MKLTERMKTIGNIKSAEQSQDTPHVHVAERLPQQSIEFTNIQAKDGSRIGLAMNQGDQVYKDQYTQHIKDHVDAAAALELQPTVNAMNVVYNFIGAEANKNSHVFERPTTYIVDKEGNLTWIANDKPEAVGMALVRKEDGSVTKLGAEAEGQINVVAPEDTLYIAPNTVLEKMKNVGELKADTFEEMMKNDAIAADLVRVDFNEVAPQEEAEPGSAADAYAKRKEHDLRALGLPKNATSKQIKEAKKAKHDQIVASRQATKSVGTNPELKSIEDGLDMAQVFANDKELQMQVAAASSRAYGFTDSQTEIIDRMKARRTVPASSKEQALEVEPEETDPEIAHERQTLQQLRNDMAKVAAKRQGRLFSLKNNKHTKLEAEYDQQLAILGKLKCVELLNDETKTDAEKNVGVIAFIFEEQQRLRQATTEQLKSTRVSKMIEWVNSGTPTQRVLRGVALGAGGVLVGAGAGAIVGVAGAGFAAAAAVTATSAMRFGRYYAREDNKEGRGMGLLTQSQSIDAESHAMRAIEQREEGEDIFTAALGTYKDRFRADTNEQQERRRKSARRAIGGVALGMVIGGTAAYAISELIDAPQVAAKPVEAAPEGGAPVSTDGGLETKQPDIIPEPVQVPEYSHDASTVTLGEGWYQTFGEIGITDSSQQYALLHNPALMQELANQGLAYPDATLGGWGINMTADGKMPAESLKLIEDYARRSGYDLAS